ncbi:hypothetical protein Tco_1353506 [Tanacetum coccineum]
MSIPAFRVCMCASAALLECNYGVIGETLATAPFWSFKARYFESYRSEDNYAVSHQGRYGRIGGLHLTKTTKDMKHQYAISKGLNTPYSRYGINIIFWKISNVVPTLRNPQYAVSNRLPNLLN